MKTKINENGIALLVVLMCLSILTVIVLDNLPQTSMTLESAKTWSARPLLERASLNGASLAAKLIYADLDENKFDSLQDKWAEPQSNTIVFKESGVSITFCITDEDGKWPINALHSKNRPIETGKKKKKGKNFTKEPKKTINKSSTIIDKRHKDILKNLLKPLENGSELTEDIAETIINIPGHRFYCLADLKQVKDIEKIYDGIKNSEPEDETDENYQKWKFAPFANFMSIYSSKNLININTAPREVLAALFNQSDSETIDKIIENRQETPFESSNDLKGIAGINPADLTKVRPLLTVSSSMFRVDVVVKLKDRQLLRSFFISRTAKECKLIFWSDNLEGFTFAEESNEDEESEEDTENQNSKTL